MSYYEGLSAEDLAGELDALERELAHYKAAGLALNLSRGKPSQSQLALSLGMFDVLTVQSDFTDGGIDCLNYGCIEGIPSARALMAAYLQVSPDQVILYGQSSLNLMYDVISAAYSFGIKGSRPWKDLSTVKFICPTPGYDRHYAICEAFGIELVGIPLEEDGPNLDTVRELVKDPQVKGIWCVPKYSNPSGITYSDEVVEGLARLKPAAPDFRIFWDNAYAEHHLYADDREQILPLLELCAQAGNEDIAYLFGSTSKITFPGSGISAFAASRANVDDYLVHMSAQTIGHDKVNQLRHVRYFGSLEGLRAHMDLHANILRPKFELVFDKLEKGLATLGVATWTKPKGGYFISFDGPVGSAKRIVSLMRSCGVIMTDAGATFPYGKDPNDTNIRVAPSFATLEELDVALDVFVCCVKYVAAQIAAQSKEAMSQKAER